MGEAFKGENLTHPRERITELEETQQVQFCCREMLTFLELLIEFDHQVERPPLKRDGQEELLSVSGRFPKEYNLQVDIIDRLKEVFQPPSFE